MTLRDLAREAREHRQTLCWCAFYIVITLFAVVVNVTEGFERVKF